MPNGPNSVGAMRPALGTGPQVQQAGPRAPVMTTRPVPPGGGGGPPGTVGHAVGGGMPQRPLVNGSTQALNPSGTPATQRPSSGVCARPLGTLKDWKRVNWIKI